MTRWQLAPEIPPPSKCVFCNDEDADLTWEHIYGNWMTPLLGEPAKWQRRTTTWTNATTGESGPTIRWTTKRKKSQTSRPLLCGTCNNEWGSRLESAVIPLMTDLIAGTTRNVKAKESVALAAWTTKVAILREYLDPEEYRVIPESVRLAFRRRDPPTPPAECLILLARIPDHAVNWPHRDRNHPIYWVPPGQKVALPNPQGVPYKANVAHCSFGFGRVFLTFLWSINAPLLDPSGPGVEPRLVRLWPDPEAFRFSPVKSMEDGELEALSLLTGGLVPFWTPPI